MKTSYFLYFILVIFNSSCNPKTDSEVHSDDANSKGKEIHFYTADSIKVYADLYQQDSQGATILLFHQGGANVRSEYAPIIPRLLEEGYNILAVDQRVGGQLLGSYNRTVADIGINRYNYCDAYPDLEASVNYIKNNGFNGKLIAWGSSFSAALAIKLAHENPDSIDAVLAFSPASGEPLAGCNPNGLFETLKTPMLLLRPYDEAQIESVRNQIALADQFGHQTYVANNGRHGSSMLVEDRVQAPVKANWKAVLRFLEEQKN
ncbi:alpha/beta hydrolase [Hanstruepera flava]|uniref:alpha/beta hydrolase n=1 Tax=Hanstruepera flava TaxID=2930218 RepID=UPI002028EE81|nr:alpha/beta fold hydrolase [Hanstruepera flava]